MTVAHLLITPIAVMFFREITRAICGALCGGGRDNGRHSALVEDHRDLPRLASLFSNPGARFAAGNLIRFAP